MKVLFGILLIIFMGIFTSCEEDCTDCGSHVHMVEITYTEVPQSLLANLNQWYTYRVRVSGDLDDFDVDSIICMIEGPNHQPLSFFTLFDDGNLNQLTGPDYASPTSGDIVANNNVFSRDINGMLLADNLTGNYLFSFNIRGHNLTDGYLEQIGGGPLEVQLINSSTCEITSYPQTQNFAECFAPQTFELHVRPGAQDHIDTVQVTLIDGISILQTVRFSQASSDSVWNLNFTPRFFKCTSTGNNYILNFQAKTRLGFICNEAVTGVSFTNHIPVLSNSVMADTAYRPINSGDSTIIVITVDLTDCEMSGAGTDLNNRVQFEVSRDNMSDWQSDISFFLRDDGIAPDTVSGNDRYSSFLKLLNNGLTNNMYYFRYYYVDCAPPNLQSDYLLDSVRVLQAGGLHGNDLPQISELGISVFQTPNHHD